MKNFLISTTFLAIIAALLWSTAFAGVKIGLQYQTPLRFGSLRFILAGLMVFLINGKWKTYLSAFSKHWRFLCTIAFIQVVIQYGMFYLGMNLVPGAMGAMIVGSSPVFVAMVSHFAHPDDKMTLPKTISFLVGMIGIAIITLGKNSVEINSHWAYVGIILLILNNIASGYSNVLVSRYRKPLSPYILTSGSLFVGGILLFLISIPVEHIKISVFPWDYYLALVWLAFLSASAFSIWYRLLKRPGVKVSELNVWKFLIPVSGAGLSWILVKGEHPDWISITGMIIISLSLLLMNNSAGKKEYHGKMNE